MCGINFLFIELWLIGDEFGCYCFVIDVDGYIEYECMVDVLFGICWFSLCVVFFGLYLCVDC